MGIRDYNIDTENNQFARKIISLPIQDRASTASDVAVAGFRSEFDGKILSAIFRCTNLTDADNSVRVDIKKNGQSLLTTSVDPGSADVTTTFLLTDSDLTDGDIITCHLTTGEADVVNGFFQFEVRPLLGSVELDSPIANN